VGGPTLVSRPTAVGGPTRVALVGATGHGGWHRRVIAELEQAGRVRLVALGDVREVPDLPPGVPVFADHRELLAQARPEVVVVCTPPHTHTPIATDALRAGADVLLEKPPVLDLAEHAALARVLAETGRSCQVGFQALASPALAELLAFVDAGGLGRLRGITMRGAWFRDEAYFTRSAWVGRSTVDGHPTLDGALANPFAHAVMQVLAIARALPTRVEVERYRTRDIEVDDTATLRLTFPDGLRALLAVTLCAEEYVPGEIVVTGTAGRAVHGYPTDTLQLPGEPAATSRPGRVNLLANLLDHRADPTGVPLLVPLARTAAFTTVLGPVTGAPVSAVDPAYLTTRHDLASPRLVISGVNAAVAAAARELALFSELNLPWAAHRPAAVPGGTR
jgi:predicted dehydrogenase